MAAVSTGNAGVPMRSTISAGRRGRSFSGSRFFSSDLSSALGAFQLPGRKVLHKVTQLKSQQRVSL